MAEPPQDKHAEAPREVKDSVPTRVVKAGAQRGIEQMRITFGKFALDLDFIADWPSTLKFELFSPIFLWFSVSALIVLALLAAPPMSERVSHFLPAFLTNNMKSHKGVETLA